MRLQLDKVQQGYAGQPVLRGLSLELASGEIGCLLGPSGCGKTTALRCIAGFEPLQAGAIHIGDKLVSSPDVCVPPQQRHVGMVFQEAALLPHLSAAENVAFGLHRLDAAQRTRRVSDYMEMVGLTGVGKRFPHEMSGGQQQRVALARALAPGPGLLLLDEPFANLDAALRERLGHELREIVRQTGVTTLMVTHDQAEAFMLADRIGLMRSGAIAQWDTPQEIYRNPRDRDVAAFVGQGVFLTGVVADEKVVEVAGLRIAAAANGYEIGDRVDVLLRPGDVVIEPSGAEAHVIDKVFRGATVIYTLQLATGEQVLAEWDAENDFGIDAVTRIGIKPGNRLLFRAS